MALEFRVLGPLEVWDDNTEIVLRGPKQRLLLACLLVNASHAVPTARLVSDIWGTAASDAAVHGLRVHLSTLRRALGAGGEDGGPLVTVAGGYRLEVPGDIVDAARFEQLAAEGASLLANGAYDDAVMRLDLGLGLWRGGAYGELAPLEPIQAEARRLDELHQTALEDWIDAGLHLGRHAELVPTLREHAERERFRERAWSLLIRALYQGGQQAEALATYREVRAVLGEELGVDPTPELQELQQQILRHDPGLRPRRTPSSRRMLPVPLTSFVGRDDEQRQLGDLLDASRLVTVTGIGGVGKTRLALQTVHRLANRFRDGAGWVELSALRDPELVADAALAAFGYLQAPDQPATDTLIERLRDGSALLVLDNCEHLLDACAAMVDRLLQAAPGVTVLCTSREFLRLPGETVWVLDPLATSDESAIGPAVRLFADRANDVNPDFELTPDTTPLATRICQRLDGLPLAIELAAVHVNMLGLDEILARLDDQFALLTRGSRTADPRQATLEAALDWSHARLTPGEQALLAALSVFSGTFDLAAAERVCQPELPADVAVLDALHGLVAKSLVNVAAGRAGRFVLLQTVRDYAARRVDDTQRAALVARHLDHYRGLVRTAAPKLQSSEQLVWLARLDDELDNLRQALEGAQRAGDVDTGLELSGRLSRYWFLHSHLREGSRWIEHFLDASKDVPSVLRARALVGAGSFLWEQGRDDQARRLLEEGRIMAAEHASSSLEGWALAYLSLVDNLSGEHEQALEHAGEAIERFGAQNLAGLGFATWQQTVARYLPTRNTARADGSRLTARATIETLLDAARPFGERNLIGHLLWSLGILALDGDDTDQATSWLLESLRHFHELGLQSCATHTLDELARAAVAAGDPRSACRLVAATDAIRKTLGVPGHVVERREWDTVVAAVGEQLDDSEHALLWESGRALDLDSAIRLAQRVGSG